MASVTGRISRIRGARDPEQPDYPFHLAFGFPPIVSSLIQQPALAVIGFVIGVIIYDAAQLKHLWEAVDCIAWQFMGSLITLTTVRGFY